MNTKRTFGIILTVLGIAGLIYCAVIFMQTTGTRQIKSLIVYGLLGCIFFFTGISLIRTTHDDIRPPIGDEGWDQRRYNEPGRY
jgi:uncharacterized membrane protein